MKNKENKKTWEEKLRNFLNIERNQDEYCGFFALSSIKNLSEVTDETEILIFFNNNAVA